MITDPLRVALQELARELQPVGIKLIVAGGYGLVLRVQHVRASGVRVLGPSMPGVRGTEDIDFFLGTELITDGASTKAIREALDRLGYSPIVEHMQFTRTQDADGIALTTKFDFLAAPVPETKRTAVKISSMRIRPWTFNQLHAYVTPEAFSVEEELLAIDVSDDGSGLFVYLPHPFSYLVLKLIALRDRLAKSEPQGKYHALDLYTVWATISEADWGQAERLRERFAEHPVMHDARAAAEALFAASDSLGVVALRDQARRQQVSIPKEVIDLFRADLRRLLGKAT